MRRCAHCGATGGGLDGLFVNREWFCSDDCAASRSAGEAPRMLPPVRSPSRWLSTVLAKAIAGSLPARRELERLDALSEPLNHQPRTRSEGVEGIVVFSSWSATDASLKKLYAGSGMFGHLALMGLTSADVPRLATPIASPAVRAYFDELPTWMYVFLDDMEEKTGDAVPPRHTPAGSELLGSPEKRDDEAA